MLKEVCKLLYELFDFKVTRSHTRSDHLISDFCDGSLYKNHPLFANTNCSDASLKLQFIIYYDDVEITKLLGSHKGKHKLGKIQYHVCVIVKEDVACMGYSDFCRYTYS